MIYFDNSATTLQKPPAVAQAVAAAIGTLGNAGRSFYPAAMQAARAVHAARAQVAQLTGAAPANVAFTSSATESLNLVASAILTPGSKVVTTVLEHNSVLRPLYNMGCQLFYINCTDEGELLWQPLEEFAAKGAKFVFATHGSNVLGTVTDAYALYARCRALGLTLVLDVSQTLGQIETRADMADILCFTGHKALLGPQGTGGIIAQNPPILHIPKTGGSGANSFAQNQGTAMPEVFEAGTANSHSLAGLAEGCRFVQKTGLAQIERHEAALTQQFLRGVANLPGVKVYGTAPGASRLPVVAVAINGVGSEETALALWEQFEICVRPGSHCAPLLHGRMGTVQTGMVRFSFGFFNTQDEIETGIQAIAALAKSSADA